MEYRNLYYFLHLCKDMNYSMAAGKLYITQQALSKSIKALERELGSPLFSKSPAGLRLTPYGEAVYPICREMIQHFEAGLQKINSISRDGIAPIRLAISYQSADSLSFSLLEDFMRVHPHTRILPEALPDLPAEEAVLSGKADFVLTIGIPQKKEFFHYERIRPLPLCILVGPNHPLSQKKVLRMQDLDHMELHCAGSQFKTYHLLKRKAEEAGITLTLIPTSGYLYATYKNIFTTNQAIIGVGDSHEELGFPNARQLPFEDPELNWDIYFCYRKDYAFTLAEREFCQYILGFRSH